MDFTRLAILGIMDVLLLAELTFSIWVSHFKPESFTLTFLTWFIPLAGLTVWLARRALRRLARLRASQDPASRPEGHRFQPVGLFGRDLPPGPSGR